MSEFVKKRKPCLKEDRTLEQDFDQKDASGVEIDTSSPVH